MKTPVRAAQDCASRSGCKKGETAVTARQTEQKTAVFTPLTEEETEKTRAFPALDGDTKELPLIADRFAGRYWDGRAEEAQPSKPARRRRRRTAFAFGFSSLAAMLLLVLSLVGQARLAAMNDELVAVSGEITELQTEQRSLLVKTEAAESFSAIEERAVNELGMQPPRMDQRSAGTAEPSDRATVLNIRRGEGLRYAWRSFLDTLVECF